jgi:hypothetical protein
MRREERALILITLAETVEELNPMLRGWANYLRTGNAATTFRSLQLCRPEGFPN